MNFQIQTDFHSIFFDIMKIFIIFKKLFISSDRKSSIYDSKLFCLIRWRVETIFHSNFVIITCLKMFLRTISIFFRRTSVKILFDFSKTNSCFFHNFFALPSRFFPRLFSIPHTKKRIKISTFSLKILSKQQEKGNLPCAFTELWVQVVFIHVIQHFI